MGLIAWATYLGLKERRPIHIHHEHIQEKVSAKVSVIGSHIPIKSDANHESLEWGKLLIDDKGKTLRLRFLPDTKTQSQDASILVLFGYKAIFGFDEVNSSVLNWEVKRALRECPNRPNPMHYWLTGDVYRQLADIDYGTSLKDKGYAERIRLSEGGFLRLTKEGERIGLSLAHDAIRRA
jgi:hypothetical protein